MLLKNQLVLMQIARILEDKVDYLTNLNELISYVIKSKIWVSLLMIWEFLVYSLSKYNHHLTMQNTTE